MDDIQNIIGYKFKSDMLLMLALTHSSFSNESKLPSGENNERLEFLGDAVLEITVSEYLYNRYPSMSEGDLTKLRAAIVCEPSLAQKAKDLNLGKYIRIGKGEEQTGGRTRGSILADAVEAIIGAMYLDGGFNAVKKFIVSLIEEDNDRWAEASRTPDGVRQRIMHSDYKTFLQEYVQSYSREPLEYTVTDEQGPDHSKVFYVSLSHMGKQIGTGQGRTKKEAEQSSAFVAIKNMGLD